MSKFVVSRRKNGEYQFTLVANNGEVILASEGYTSKIACENGIESVKKNAIELIRFDRMTSSNGKYYFNLKATNGQIIGSSELYESLHSRDKGIESVVNSVKTNTIEDTTS